MSLPNSTRGDSHRPPAPSSRLTRLVGECLGTGEQGGKEILVLEARSQAGSSLSTLALAGLLAQHEEEGDRVDAVRLLVRRREDAEWVVPLIEWLRSRDQLVLVRTRVRLRGDLVECLRHEGVPVELELAHHDAQLQRVLLDGHADSVQALLLQAQHLAMIDVEPSVRLGPLLPGVHDEQVFRRLVALVRGADIHRYRLHVGSLHSDALAELGRVLGSAQAMTLTRAFRVSPMVLFEGLETSLRLPPMMSRGLIAAYERIIANETELVADQSLRELLDRRGRGSASRGALALELFSDASLAS